MKTTLLEFIYQFEVNKGTKEVFGNFFFKATKSENSNGTTSILKIAILKISSLIGVK